MDPILNVSSAAELKPSLLLPQNPPSANANVLVNLLGALSSPGDHQIVERNGELFVEPDSAWN